MHMSLNTVLVHRLELAGEPGCRRIRDDSTMREGEVMRGRSYYPKYGHKEKKRKIECEHVAESA
jgi:hypothetical protein